jgi:hypothetical protein
MFRNIVREYRTARAMEVELDDPGTWRSPNPMICWTNGSIAITSTVIPAPIEARDLQTFSTKI